MALSGTLETFSLPDVLRLLSSTKKTGLLALDGDRGVGRVWVRDGDIVAARADRSVVDDVDAVLFELLRFADAAFEFEAGTSADSPGEARSVDAALELAQERLEEWREIEAVVPSLDVRVRMVPELDGAVEVEPTMWRLLARIGTGASGHDVAHHVGEGEFHVCRSLRDLVEVGMVEVTGVEEEAPAEDVDLPEMDAPAAHESLAVADAFAAMVHAPHREADPEAGFEVLEDDEDVEEPVAAEAAPEPPSSPDDELASIFGAPAAPEPEQGPEPVATTSDADDLLSDLAHLSPKAAAAVEATWGAEPGDAGDDAVEPPAAPAEAGAGGGDDLDQNLLLRFLSSAKH